MSNLSVIVKHIVTKTIDNGLIQDVKHIAGMERSRFYQLRNSQAPNPTITKAEKLFISVNHPLTPAFDFFANNLEASALDLIIHLLSTPGIKMDLLERADQESSELLQRAIENSKSPEVIPTTECIDCDAQISPERAKAVKTNLCIGCAELKEIKDKNYK
jgi:hypothetical protein